MIPGLIALIPHQSLPHGRTRPTIVEAEDSEGGRHEVVVGLVSYADKLTAFAKTHLKP